MFLCSAYLSLSLATFFLREFSFTIMASLLLSACFWFSKMYLSQAAWSHRPQSVIGSWILMDSVSRSDKWSSSVREKEQLARPIPAESEPAPSGSERNQPFHHLSSISLSSTSLHQSVSLLTLFPPHSSRRLQQTRKYIQNGILAYILLQSIYCIGQFIYLFAY